MQTLKADPEMNNIIHNVCLPPTMVNNTKIMIITQL
jgi:hypothetical protein